MAGTFLSLDYHIVFSTKNREQLITGEFRDRFHEYLGGTLNGLGARSQGVGGMSDHVHLLIGLKATHCLADILRELKKSSSIFAKEHIPRFAWQDGYAAFTVSATARDAVKRYIANQETHHRTKSFTEELSDMLRQAGVEFDPQHLS